MWDAMSFSISFEMLQMQCFWDDAIPGCATFGRTSLESPVRRQKESALRSQLSIRCQWNLVNSFKRNAKLRHVRRIRMKCIYVYMKIYVYVTYIYMQAYVKCICNVCLHEARCIFIVWGFLPLFVLCGLQLVSCEMFLFESSLLSISFALAG